MLLFLIIVLMLIDYFADENRKKNSHNKYNKNFYIDRIELENKKQEKVEGKAKVLKLESDN